MQKRRDLGEVVKVAAHLEQVIGILPHEGHGGAFRAIAAPPLRNLHDLQGMMTALPEKVQHLRVHAFVVGLVAGEDVRLSEVMGESLDLRQEALA